MTVLGLGNLRHAANFRGLVVEHNLQDVDGRCGVLIHKPLNNDKIQELKACGYKLTPAGPNYTAVWMP